MSEPIRQTIVTGDQKSFLIVFTSKNGQLVEHVFEEWDALIAVHCPAGSAHIAEFKLKSDLSLMNMDCGKKI